MNIVLSQINQQVAVTCSEKVDANQSEGTQVSLVRDKDPQKLIFEKSGGKIDTTNGRCSQEE